MHSVCDSATTHSVRWIGHDKIFLYCSPLSLPLSLSLSPPPQTGCWLLASR